METMAKELIQGLLGELECPVCLEYMLPPITFCENGHNVCNDCKPKLLKCPTCRTPFVNIRNVALENISRQIEYPCTYRKLGCNFTFPSTLILEHQNHCSYGPYLCPFSITGGVYCPWKGTLAELRKHLQSTHADETTEASSRLCINFNDVTAPGTYNFVIFTLGQIFFRHAVVNEDNFYCVLQLVGPTTKAFKFKYKFTISTKDGEENVSFCRLVRSYKEDMHELFRSRKCVKLHLDVVKDYLNEKNDLPNEIEIIEI